MRCRDLPIRKAYELLKLGKALEEASKVYMEAKKKVIEKHSEKDENGNVKMEKGQVILPRTPEGMAALNFDMNELLSLTADISFDKIELKLDEIPKGVVSAADLDVLEQVIKFS
jgi:hypothetical protein